MRYTNVYTDAMTTDTDIELGDCFVVAAGLLLADDNLTLCHGTVLCTTEGGTAAVGERHWHAWVERTDTIEFGEHRIEMVTVIDKSNGHDAELPQALYYHFGRIEDVRRYNATEASVLMLKHGHYGPWEDEDD